MKKSRRANKEVLIETDQGDFKAAVVGADDSNEITRRCIPPNDPVYTARALEVLTPGPPAAANQDAAFFDFFPIPQNIAGCVWDFPTQVNGTPMRCWGVRFPGPLFI